MYAYVNLNPSRGFTLYNCLHLSSESYKGTIFKCLHDKRNINMCLCANVCTMCCVPEHIHHVCVHTYMHMHLECSCQNQVSFWSTAHLIFWDRILHWTWAHILADCLGNKSQRYTMPCFTAACIMVTDSHNRDKLYYMGPGDLNSGPHTCIVGSLPTESSPQSNISFLKKKKMHIEKYLLLGSRMC